MVAELAADAAHKASEKERDAERLADFIANNTDPSGRGRYAPAKEKRKAHSPKEKRSSHVAKEKKSKSKSTSSPILPNSLLTPVLFSIAVDVSKLDKTPEGLAIWPPLPAHASAPQVPNEVSCFVTVPSTCLLILLHSSLAATASSTGLLV